MGQVDDEAVAAGQRVRRVPSWKRTGFRPSTRSAEPHQRRHLAENRRPGRSVPDDYVLEVGPGIGTLTVALLKSVGRVLSVERDPDLPAVLARRCPPGPTVRPAQQRRA
ncbi:MAG: rRNA adenine N-6-methyltransferase family protein [Adlercreutzia equolifaciens]